jgi:beta-galactosidase
VAVQPLPSRRLGVAYYPEHWDESRWASDAALLRDAGVSMARMMEFAWDKLEPREGVYQFDWMNRALEVFAQAGIQVLLCTPTPTPPPWLTLKYPEVLYTDPHTGIVSAPGSRRHVNANSPAYQELSAKITTVVADQWGQHSNVIGWQIDNEFGCHSTTRDGSAATRKAFQVWLEAKYGSLDALNQAWGTQFWSATYSDWAEVPLPLFSAATHNPGLLLDYRRFSSDAWVRFQKMQVDILRPRIGADRFITHNFMLKFFELDYYQLARDLDFVGYDNYLHGMSGPMEAAFNLDLMRATKGGRPFWVMEQQPGMVNWTPYGLPVPPGQVRAWTHQAFGHGAEAVLYFRERAVNIGQEQYHAGMLKHDGTPDRCYYESQAVSQDLAAHPQLTRPKAAVGLIFDYEDLWMFQLDPHNSAFSYYNVVLSIYNQLWEAQIPVDVLARDADLSGYQTVILPCPGLIDAAQTAKWRAYVEAGGNLITTFRAGFKTQGSVWTDQPMPAGGLSELFGAVVDEFISISPRPEVGIREAGSKWADWNDDRGSHVVDLQAKLPGFGFGDSFGVPPKERYSLWAEVLKPTTATPIMRYADGYYKDGIAATANKVGAGMAYLIGCWLEPFIPRSVWAATGLSKLATIDREVSRNVVEIFKMEDPAGNSVEMRVSHGKNTVTFSTVAAEVKA